MNRCYEFGTGDHTELGSQVICDLEHDGYKDFVYDEGALYGWRETVWEKIERAQLSCILQDFSLDGSTIGPTKPLHINASTVSGAISNLYDRYNRPRFFSEAAPGIAFTNGFATISADGISVLHHDPGQRARHAYPFALPEIGDAPVAFLDYCEDVFAPDGDSDVKIAAIQEHLGACICGLATKYERALLLVGRENCGKSSMTRFFTAAMPPNSISSLPPSLMHDQYALPRLRGARLNVVADLGREKISGYVKLIISGEMRTAREPGAAPFDLIPRAGHLYAVNPPMPEVDDLSGGFERRWIIITFNRTFKHGDPKRDPDITEKITASELPKIVRWGLEGAVRLLAQKRHTLPDSGQLVLDHWMDRNDPVRRYVESRLVIGDEYTRASELYAGFKAWLSAVNVKMAFNTKRFGMRLRELGFEAVERSDGVYYGLSEHGRQ